MKNILRDKVKDLLRPGYYACKDILDPQGRKRLKKNIILNDLYSGKRAFLLLTGESLQQVDINKLKDEYTMGANLIFLHEDIGKIGLDYFVILGNEKIMCPALPQWSEYQLGPLGHAESYREIDKRLGHETILILHSDTYKCIEKHAIFQQKTIYYAKCKKRLRAPVGVPYNVVADLTRRSISGGGVVFFSILIMLYMGFKEIYLCGAGYTYEPTYQCHFYDNRIFPMSMGRKSAEIEARKAIDARNRKTGSTAEYFGLFEKGSFYRSICVMKKGEGSYVDHRILNDYARSQGLKIYNIVPDGFESPVYEKVTWEEVENDILSGEPA